MASRRITTITVSSLLVLAAAGAVIYAVARQGDGNQVLAQSPLNAETQIEPAFIMGMDNSGSMSFELLLPGNDGMAYWDTATGGTAASRCASAGTRNNCFFDTDGDIRTTAGGRNYVFVMPTAVRTNSASMPGAAGYKGVPPIRTFGFARSPEFNPSYYDPNNVYLPWKKYDGSSFANPTPANMVDDPRSVATTGYPRMDMTSLRRDRTDDADDAPDTQEMFTMSSGAVLPSGSVYYLAGATACGGLGTTTATRNTWVTTTAAVRVTADCDIGIEFFPATFYLKTTTAPPDLFVAANKIAATNACGDGCTMYAYEIKPANYATTAAYTAAIQNFANWFYFYGNRERATIAGMTNALVDVNNMRIGFFKIHEVGQTSGVKYEGNLTADTANNLTMRTMSDAALGGARDVLYRQITRRNTDASLGLHPYTPNHVAVNKMGTQFQRTDAGAPIQLACQKNAGMLFTDGYANNNAGPVPTVGNQDSGMGTPFADAHSNTLADIAAKYYRDAASGGIGAAPLRSDLTPGLVPVPDECATLPTTGAAWKRLDCQRNLHMNFYGVTLGTRGYIYEAAGFENQTDDPFTYTPGWLADGLNSPTQIDNLWHATLNSRGEFINAKTPADITSAMRRVLSSVGAVVTPSGSIAVTGSRVGAGSLSVVPSYESTNNGTDWYSTLTAQTVSSNPYTGAISYTPAWEATAQLPAYGARNIRVGKTTGSVNPVVTQFNATNVTLADLCSNPATFSNCTSAAITALGVSLAQSINYLRGDQTQERATTGALRRRTKVLGDIVNSSPLVSAPTDDYGYRSLRGAAAGTYNPFNYDGYLTAKASRSPVVYAGANDGMLHAFNGTTGVEQFAYIPATALGHMGNLLFPYVAADGEDQTFQHRYYVDGPTTVSDAYYGGAWHTALVGTAGAGGRSVYALDVSAPATFGNTNVLWEINDRVTNTAIKNNIGHVLGKPIIVPVKLGPNDSDVAWKAIFGNGYGSINGKAALFIVDLATGAVTTVLADEANAALPAKNGLGNIIVLDRYLGTGTTKNSDGYADTVYGGDQNGAVWKFDLRTATPAAQSTPFFIARDSANNRQGITGGFTAASGPGGGIILYFGTGSFSFKNDGTDESMQSLYGIQDRETGAPVSGRGVLQLQKVLTDTSGNRTITTTAPAAGTRGWYIDLGVTGGNASAAASGERSIGNPAVEGGVVFFPTYEPVSGGCSVIGANRLYGLNALSGGAAFSQVSVGSPTATPSASGTGALALNTGGTAPVRDVAVMTTARVQPITCVPGSAGCVSVADAATALAARCSMVVQVAGAPSLYLPRACGRQSWRQVR